MSRSPRFLLSSLLALFTTSSLAGPISIDGNLSDWGINVADGTWSQKVGTSYSGLRTDLAGYMVEDTNDTTNNYTVGPYSGGQNYDGEFFGGLIQGNTLYLAILTGQRPDNGLSYFAPGDIRITTSSGLFGIEVGGGLGGASGATAIHEGDAGTTYQLNQYGYTKGLLPTAGSQTAGSVWMTADSDWIEDPISSWYAPGTEEKVQIKGGAYAGMATDYIFTRNEFTNTHAIIELALSMDIFGEATLEELYWSPSCSNDRLYFTPKTTVPEPATLALLGVGLLGIGAVRRRARR